jgi:stage II sporulation protein R
MKPRQSFKSLGILAFALIVLITCWESNPTNAAVITPEIPKESIRLRILANSDSAQDQALKREIRDAIVARMQEWVQGPHTIEEARAVVTAHIPEFDLLVGDMIRERGYAYTHQVELGIVPFPTKMYGDEVYPAGDYEALRVIIGEGKGQNWWCVLFPPLCFVDSVSGEAVATSGVLANKSDKSRKLAADAKSESHVSKLSDNKQDAKGITEGSVDASVKPEVRFFLWDLIQTMISWFK